MGQTGVGLGDLERHLIAQAFDAFAWRTKPARFMAAWDSQVGSKEAAERLLARTLPCELDDETFSAAFPEPSLIVLSTTPEALLYYLPAIVSHCVRDIERQRRQAGRMYDLVGLSYGTKGATLAHAIEMHFRRRPYHLDLPIRAWPRFMDAAAGDQAALAEPGFAAEVAECGRDYLMEGTRFWLMVSAPERSPYRWMWRDVPRLVSSMTVSEREVIASFFDYLVAAGVREEPDIASIKALLAGRGVMEVLRVRTDGECMEIVDALRALENRHPEEFPPREVAPVKNLLLDIVAGKRSPDTTLGW